jgi:hypothetical protein
VVVAGHDEVGGEAGMEQREKCATRRGAKGQQRRDTPLSQRGRTKREKTEQQQKARRTENKTSQNARRWRREEGRGSELKLSAFFLVVVVAAGLLMKNT